MDLVNINRWGGGHFHAWVGVLVLLLNVCKPFIVLVSNGDRYINIVKIEDLARLMAGGDVFAIHKKIGGRVFWVGIVVICGAELG